MITTENNESKNVRVAFHIGRGGRFNNAGHKRFLPNVSKLQDCFGENSYIIDEDENGNALPDEQWQLNDDGGNVILKGREAIESETGILEWDTIYDTDIVRDIEDCTDEEMEILYKAYLKHELRDDDAIDYVCDWMGVKRISSVKFYRTNATIHFTDHTFTDFNWDGEEDVEEDEIKEWMAEENIDEKSIQENYEDFVIHFQKN